MYDQPKFFQGQTLEEQYRFMKPYGELRVLPGVYGTRLVYRGEMGQLMGGDRIPSDIQAKWDSLEVYEPPVEIHEHEILVAVVVRTDAEREAAYSWLLKRLRKIEDPQAQNDDETHVDSYWIAEDDRPSKAPQQGLRSAVFVPEPLTQVEASSLLDYESEHK